MCASEEGVEEVGWSGLQAGQGGREWEKVEKKEPGRRGWRVCEGCGVVRWRWRWRWRWWRGGVAWRAVGEREIDELRQLALGVGAEQVVDLGRLEARRCARRRRQSQSWAQAQAADLRGGGREGRGGGGGLFGDGEKRGTGTRAEARWRG